MMEAFLHGIIAGYGIAIPVGAIAVLIIDTGVRRGLRQGFAAGAGAATADLVYALVAVGAGGMLVPLLAPLTPQVRIASGLVLIGLAACGFLSLRRRRTEGPSATTPEGRARATFARFLALTLVNPLTVVYFAALVVGGSPAGAGPMALVLFAAGAFMASLSWQTLLAIGGSSLGAALPRGLQTATGAVGHSMVLGFGLLMIF